jgi:hypothetical protein
MNAEEVRNKVRESINLALRPLIGTKMDATAKMRAKAVIMDVLAHYYNDGTIDEIPLIDINHETELAYLTNAIRNMYLEIDGTEDEQTRLALAREMSGYSMRANELRRQMEGLGQNSIQIFLKNPNTYEPFVWYGRSQYEN